MLKVIPYDYKLASFVKKSYLEVYKEGYESHLWVPNMVSVSLYYKSPWLYHILWKRQTDPRVG